MDTISFINNCKSILANNGIDNTDEVYYIACAFYGLNKADFIMGKQLTAGQQRAVKRAINKRTKGKSLQLILGKVPFLNIEILDSKHTLTPRPETEYMTSIIASGSPCKVLDLCAGSGAIGLALANKDFDVTLSDVSPHAIRQIKRNAKHNGLNVRVLRSDMFDKIDGKYNIIVSNPPYITSADCLTLSTDVLNNDPIMALDGGADGLDFYRVIADNAHRFLLPDGVLYLEIGLNQEQCVQKLLEKHYKNITIIKDLNNINRIIKAEVK